MPIPKKTTQKPAATTTPAAPKKPITINPKPVTPKPAVVKPLAPKPAVKKPLAPKPAVKKPLAPKPAVVKPLAPKPGIRKPVVAAPVAAPVIKHVWGNKDTYAELAFKHYGSMKEPYWRLIYEHNKALIGDHPNNIKVGMEIVIPPLPEALKKK